MTKRTKKAWTKWRRLVSEQALSGQTVIAFCRERGLCRPYFFAWKKRLRENPVARFLEVQVTERAPISRDSRIENPAAERPETGRGARVRYGAGASVAGGGGGGGVIGLPRLHATDREQGARIWMANEVTDMRCGFDRLAERVKKPNSMSVRRDRPL